MKSEICGIQYQFLRFSFIRWIH